MRSPALRRNGGEGHGERGTTIDADFDLIRFAEEEYPAVVAAVRLITGERDAADSVQDALVKYLADPPAHEIRNLAAWLTVVAVNRCRDRRRRASAEQRALARYGPPASIEIADPMNADVLRALRALPRRQREICVLHYVLDRPIADIAESLGITTGTVKTQLHRARVALAARLSSRAPRPSQSPRAVMAFRV